MTHFRPSFERFAFVGCLCFLVNACRSDAGAPETKGQRANAPSAAPSAAAAQPSAPEAPKNELTVPAAAASTEPADTDAGCAGPTPPGVPMPHFEQRKLASVKERHYRFELLYPVFPEQPEKVSSKLNREILEHLTVLQKRFVNQADAVATAPDPDNARWFEGRCDVGYHSMSFTTVVCETMEGPGAHPHLDKFALNFQICPDVRRLDLADLCRSLPQCRKKIIELINEDFRAGQKKETDIQFREGPAGTNGGSTDAEQPIAALRAFAITPVGLRIFLFDELPHVLQAFAIVDLPAAKVRPVLRDDVARRLWRP
jgi:hypothetical protein